MKRRILLIPSGLPGKTYLNHKELCKAYWDKLKELQDQIKHNSKLEKDITLWRDAYWDLMYKRYMSLGASELVEKNVIHSFTNWIQDQIRVSLEIRSLKSNTGVNEVYLRSLKKDLLKISKSIKNTKSILERKKRELAMVENTTNQEMIKANDLIEEDKTRNTVTKFKPRLITGGSGGWPNWLSTLAVGTIFTCARRGDLEFIAYQFEIDWKGEKSALLTSNLPHRVELPVKMATFSMAHELLDVQRKGYEDGD